MRITINVKCDRQSGQRLIDELVEQGLLDKIKNLGGGFLTSSFSERIVSRGDEAVQDELRRQTHTMG